MFALLLLIVVILAVLEIRSLRLPADLIDYSHTASPSTIEQGEVFTMTSVYTNRSGRRIPFLRSEEYMSRAIEVEGIDDRTEGLTSEEKDDLREHKRTYTIFLRKNERVTHRVKARCYKRGIHRLTRCELGIGDYLGIGERYSTREVNSWITVYPRRLKDERVDTLVKGIIGDISVRSFVYQDPVLVRGYREYTGTEPFHDISFIQSAKTGSLIVKEFDHTREEAVDIIFDVDFKGNIDTYFTRIEACFSLVRAICEKLTLAHVRFRLITNLCCTEFSNSEITIIEADYEKLLQFLTMSGRAAACKYDVFLNYVSKHFADTDSNLVYIAQEPNKDTLTALDSLSAAYGINTYSLWGSDFEEAYNDSKVL